MGPFLVGVLLLALLLLGANWFLKASPAQLAQAVRAFIAGFGMLASTGLLFAGRFGLALITVGAAVMAIRAFRQGRAGASFGAGGDGPEAGRQSTVETAMLAMQLDHRTGELEGEVLRGPLAGRTLDSLGLSELLDLLQECGREDPRGVALLETYLDRRQPDWREAFGPDEGPDEGEGAEAGRGSRSAAGGSMDEATAWSILGLEPGASTEDIKAAHRRLMTKLHPDHGGSDYLAAQLNQAKDLLLRRARRR